MRVAPARIGTDIGRLLGLPASHRDAIVEVHMYLRELNQSVTVLRGAGPQVEARLARLGIYSVSDLLLHYPRDYDDRSVFVSLADSVTAGRAHTVIEVLSHEWFGYGRMRTLRILIRDEAPGSTIAALLCFNRPFLEQVLPIGARAVITGKFQFRRGELQSSSFEAEVLAGDSASPQGLIPLYAATEGLQQGSLRKLMKQALRDFGSHVEDEVPASILARRTMAHKREALAELHEPTSGAALAKARESLIYEELFYFQVAVARRALSRKRDTITRHPSKGLLRTRLLERLPFGLTPDQEKSAAEIVADMARPHPMGRLLQGDVGSGKTLVAFLACLEAIESGGQAAMMAPTELLARQHAQTAARLLEPLGVRLAFLSGNVEDAARPPLLAALKAGEVDLVLGTHALFSDEVDYRDLRLAVVDEQHRFGVLQRLALGRKGHLPDLLMMTATPIPRTLALTVFGDLAVSTIRTMPPGRKPIETHLARAGNEAKVYDYVRRLLEAGRQAYFVYPLISGGTAASARAELKNAEEMYERLAREIYPGYKVGLIHSRLKEDEKRETMEAFSEGRIHILVATSVVEVGVDVPNAAAMVVEHAERFGLAALHQLRGRVGRGQEQSYCFLVYAEPLTEDGKARLKAMLGTTDGFELAEEDLRIRGPGELAGTAQSGALRLAIADPARDVAILEEARRDAFAIVEADPGFLEADNAVIREVLSRANPFGEAPAGRG
jgi:ATP-dependent DNA helicase RecG